jgi:hypothetical protein
MLFGKGCKMVNHKKLFYGGVECPVLKLGDQACLSSAEFNVYCLCFFKCKHHYPPTLPQKKKLKCGTVRYKICPFLERVTPKLYTGM